MVVSTVEKAQYMPQGHGVNPAAVGPAPLVLMEMMYAANEYARYREITVRNHFTTKGMNPTSNLQALIVWQRFHCTSSR